MKVDDLKKTNIIKRKTEWYNFKALSAKSIKRGTPSNNMRRMPFSTIFHQKNFIKSNKTEKKTDEQHKTSIENELTRLKRRRRTREEQNPLVTW